MPADNSCGDHPMWDYDNVHEYESAIDPAQQEIKELKSQIMSMQIRIQADELEKLTEKVVRDKNPTLKDAWEKYQAVLRLTSNK